LSQKELIQIANRFAPAFLAVFQIQRYEIAIRRFDIKRIAQNAYAAIADVDAALRFPGVMPDFASRARVNRPDVIGHREIHHAIDDQRRSFNRALIDIGAKDPREAQRVDVTRIDFIQRAVTAPRIIAVIARPPSVGACPTFAGSRLPCANNGAAQRAMKRNVLMNFI
jgi:hypothetical protein